MEKWQNSNPSKCVCPNQNRCRFLLLCSFLYVIFASLGSTPRTTPGLGRLGLVLVCHPTILNFIKKLIFFFIYWTLDTLNYDNKQRNKNKKEYKRWKKTWAIMNVRVDLWLWWNFSKNTKRERKEKKDGIKMKLKTLVWRPYSQVIHAKSLWSQTSTKFMREREREAWGWREGRSQLGCYVC